MLDLYPSTFSVLISLEFQENNYFGLEKTLKIIYVCHDNYFSCNNSNIILNCHFYLIIRRNCNSNLTFCLQISIGEELETIVKLKTSFPPREVTENSTLQKLQFY